MAVEGFLVFILAELSHIRNIDNRLAPVERMKLFLYKVTKRLCPSLCLGLNEERWTHRVLLFSFY